MIAQWTADQVRLAVRLYVDQHEHASAGTRSALAGWLDSLGLELKRAGQSDVAWYAWGRADGLRRPSRSRREGAPVFN